MFNIYISTFEHKITCEGITKVLVKILKVTHFIRIREVMFLFVISASHDSAQP